MLDVKMKVVAYSVAATNPYQGIAAIVV